VSLARLGASMTGLDFSGPAVRAARELAAATGADANRRYQAVRRRDRSAAPGRASRWLAGGLGTPSRSIQWSM
jgi:hypothetical protein